MFKAGKCTAYVYGADGTRLKKIESPTATAAACKLVTAATPGANVTVTFGMQEFRNYGQGTAEEILSYPLPNIRLTYTTANRSHTVLHRDHQGSVLAITNSAGVKVQTSLYTPFGKQTNWVWPHPPAPGAQDVFRAVKAKVEVGSQVVVFTPGRRGGRRGLRAVL